MLKDQTIIVVGVGGIGSACAREFSKAGANVVLSGRRRENLEEVSRDLPPERTLIATGDANDPRDIESVFTETLDKFCGIDGVVVAIGTWTRLDLDASLEEALSSLDRSYQTLLRPGYAMIYRAQQLLREANNGLIINFSSHITTRHDLRGNHSYSPMKTAGRKFVLDIAHEFKTTEGCRVRACDISPAIVNTPGNTSLLQTEQDRANAVQPEEMAQWIIEHFHDPNIPASKEFRAKEDLAVD